MLESPEYRPKLFYTTPPKIGLEAPFPASTSIRPRPPGSPTSWSREKKRREMESLSYYQYA